MIRIMMLNLTFVTMLAPAAWADLAPDPGAVSQAAYCVALLQSAERRAETTTPPDYAPVKVLYKKFFARENILSNTGEGLGGLARLLKIWFGRGADDFTYRQNEGEKSRFDQVIVGAQGHRRLVADLARPYAPQPTDVTNQQIVGAAAIKAYLDNTKVAAVKVDEEMRSGARTAGPYAVRTADLWTQIGASAFLTTLAGVNAHAALTLFGQGHHVLGAAIGVTALMVLRPLNVVVSRVYLAGKQALVNRGIVKQPATPELAAAAQIEFADDVIALLSTESRGRGVFMHQGFRVKTALRFSEETRHARRRPAPTAPAILASLRDHDPARLPLDYREVSVDQIFRFDQTLDEPVLILRVKEIKPTYL